MAMRLWPKAMGDMQLWAEGVNDLSPEQLKLCLLQLLTNPDCKSAYAIDKVMSLRPSPILAPSYASRGVLFLRDGDLGCGYMNRCRMMLAGLGIMVIIIYNHH